MKHFSHARPSLTLTLVLSTLLMPMAAAADQPTTVRKTHSDDKQHAVNFNMLVPEAVEGHATFQVGLGGNYTYLVDPHHGVMVETGVSWMFGDDNSRPIVNSSVGYRWHWQGGQNSWFMALTGSYRFESGDIDRSTDEMEKVGDVKVQAFSLTAGVGKRWLWDSGLNLTFRAGVGAGRYNVSANSDQAADTAFADELQDDFDSLPLAYDGEFSVGYSF